MISYLQAQMIQNSLGDILGHDLFQKKKGAFLHMIHIAANTQT